MSNNDEKKLPRGIHRRGDSLVVSFALADGTIERRSVGPLTVDQAVEERVMFRRQVRLGTYEKRKPAPPPPPKEIPLPVAALWPLYVTNYTNGGGRDAGRQEIAWKKLQPTFGALAVDDVTTPIIAGYIKARQEQGVKGGTVNRELSVLQAMFRLGMRSTTTGGKPMVDRLPAFPPKLQEGPPKKGFIKDQQYATLMAHAKAPWMLAFIECAFSFGFRKSELLNLRCGQVDLLDRRITLYETKGDRKGRARKGRVVMMTQKVYERLRVMKRNKGDEDFVFTRDDGSRVVDPRQDWYDLSVVAKLGAYVPAKGKNGDYQKYVGLTPHDFRRSAVKAMKKRGVPDRVVMEIGGWRTRAVFDRYFPVDEEELKDAAMRIENGRDAEVAGTSTSTKTDTSDSMRQ